MTTYAIPLAIAAVVIGGLLISGCATGSIEEPKYALVSDSEVYEIREYQPQLVAQTVVSGDQKEASSKGFQILADYIFGNNQSQQEIAMTAPVSQASESKNNSEKIAMTAPVSQQQEGDRWVVTFTMPAKYTQETLPVPNNPAVDIKLLPADTFAVKSFSGFAREKKVNAEKEALLTALESNGVSTKGSVVLSQYNPPWTPGFMRRNEVMIAIEQ